MLFNRDEFICVKIEYMFLGNVAGILKSCTETKIPADMGYIYDCIDRSMAGLGESAYIFEAPNAAVESIAYNKLKQDVKVGIEKNLGMCLNGRYKTVYTFKSKSYATEVIYTVSLKYA